jgi:hypothetical protein
MQRWLNSCLLKAAGGAPTLPALLKLNQSGPSAEQEILGPGWNHVVHGGHVVRATSPTDHQHTPGLITETRTQSDVRNTSKKGKNAVSPKARQTISQHR